mmetsp:Transcript_15982/g.41484  ORF Transcript_15982/g.41484 Transcript_15982/m.41484 type:complete len:255 (-) Transcript_15982:313-1077(-)
MLCMSIDMLCRAAAPWLMWLRRWAPSRLPAPVLALRWWAATPSGSTAPLLPLLRAVRLVLLRLDTVAARCPLCRRLRPTGDKLVPLPRIGVDALSLSRIERLRAADLWLLAICPMLCDRSTAARQGSSYVGWRATSRSFAVVLRAPLEHGEPSANGELSLPAVVPPPNPPSCSTTHTMSVGRLPPSSSSRVILREPVSSSPASLHGAPSSLPHRDRRSSRGGDEEGLDRASPSSSPSASSNVSSRAARRLPRRP